ncbi:MAG: hypothetical protein D6795_13310, partial [Deltaproteobacteria bacterium]
PPPPPAPPDWYAPPGGSASGHYGYPPYRPAQTRPAAVQLVEQEVAVRLNVQAGGQVEEAWYTLPGKMVLSAEGRPTGLAITPAVEALASGEVRYLPGAWTVWHQASGYMLSTVPLPGEYQAQELAGWLVGVTDWQKGLMEIPEPAMQQAEAIVQRYVAGLRQGGAAAQRWKAWRNGDEQQQQQQRS